MTPDQRKRISKFLSFVLRHRPDEIGLELDDQGWAPVDDLLAKCRHAGKRISRAQLVEVVETNDKQRFALSEDGARIRASQGHSIEVELGYQPEDPPAVLYHGTVERNLAAIRTEGLKKMKRHHVHLSADVETAERVGRRRGKPIVLTIDAAMMAADGYVFLLSDNGVWLVEAVPPGYIGP